MRTLSTTLTQAQRDTGGGIYKVVFTKSGETTRGYSHDTTNRVLNIQHIIQGLKETAEINIDNREGNLTSLDLRGFQAVISYGFATGVARAAWAGTTAYSLNDVVRPVTANGYQYICTTAGTSGGSEPLWTTSLGVTNADNTVTWTMDGNQGDEYSAWAPLKAIARQRISYPYDARVIYSCVGKGNEMMEDKASADYLPDSNNTDTVKTIFIAVANATLNCFSHTTNITLSWDSEDSLIDSFAPADGFRISYGDTRLPKLEELLSWTRCVGRFEADGKLHIRQIVNGQANAWAATTAYALRDTVKPVTDNNHIYECTTAGTSGGTEPTWTTTEGNTVTDSTVVWTLRYDYSYNDLGTATTQHTFWQDGHRARLVIPNKITVESHSSNVPFYTGSATDTDSNNLLAVQDFKRLRLTSNAQATSIATAILTNLQRQAERGWGFAPLNVGQEVYDLVRITDNRTDAIQIGNIGYLLVQVAPGKFSMTFRLGEPQVGVPMGAMATNTSEASVINELVSTVSAIGAFVELLRNKINEVVTRLNALQVSFPTEVERLWVTQRLRIPVGTDMYDTEGVGSGWLVQPAIPWTITNNVAFSNILGGTCYLCDSQTQFYRYDLYSHQYAKKANLAYSNVTRYMVLRAGKVYLLVDGVSGLGGRRIGTYNILTDAWSASALASISGTQYYIQNMVFQTDDIIWAWAQNGAENVFKCLKYVISTDTWSVGANSATILPDACAAINSAGTVVFGGKTTGTWEKYTIATDTYATQTDTGRAFASAPDANRLWYYAETTPWAKGYLDTADDSLNDAAFTGNSAEEAAGHNRFAVNSTKVFCLADAKPSVSARIYGITPTISFTATGTKWIEGTDIHYWDESAQERKVTGTLV